jgi:hypothetical protein
MSLEDSAGRMSWDETTVLAAIKGYKPFWKLIQGKIKVTDDGKNTWIKKSSGHYYLVEAVSPSKVQDYINKLMMHQPVNKRE